MNERLFVLIPCAGSGSRFGSSMPKQYAKIGGKTLLEHSLAAFLAVDVINQIIVVVSQDDQHIHQYVNNTDKVILQYAGGETRAMSVLNGLNSLICEDNDWVLVHDAARCCITPQLIMNFIEQLRDDPVGGILAIPATDTVKSVANGKIYQTLPRSAIYLAQTPQMFRVKFLRDALAEANLKNVTDEASAVEQLGLAVKVVLGSVENLKVTYPLDLKIAKLILETRA